MVRYASSTLKLLLVQGRLNGMSQQQSGGDRPDSAGYRGDRFGLAYLVGIDVSSQAAALAEYGDGIYGWLEELLGPDVI